MATSSIVLIGFWSLPNCQRSWKLNATNFCATSKLDGYLWLVLLNACCLNITFSSWKWHWMHPQFAMLNLIYLSSLTWKHSWGWMQWCHYSRKYIIWLSLHNWRMVLFVFSYQRSRFVKGMYIACTTTLNLVLIVMCSLISYWSTMFMKASIFVGL
jgi:hypothetical protein